MYIKGKPIRFGYKIWCLCGNDGFPYHLQIYTGKGEERPTQPLGSRVVSTMEDVVEENCDVTRHKLFFDNFFTSYSLLDGLAERGMRSIGTARENRTAGAHKMLTASKVLKKQPRGTYDYRTNGRVYFCKWKASSKCHSQSQECVQHSCLTAQPHQPVQPRHGRCRPIRPSPRIVPPNHSWQEMVLAIVYQPSECSCCGLAIALPCAGDASHTQGLPTPSNLVLAERRCYWCNPSWHQRSRPTCRHPVRWCCPHERPCNAR